MQATTKATEHLIPHDSRVEEARKAVQNAFEDYAKESTEENQRKLQDAKSNLESVYVELEGGELGRMVAEVEEASERSRHKESWHLINSISGRKSTKQGIIKGSSREERLKKWYDYFQNLLGKVPIIPDDNIGTYLPSILHSLDITDIEFTNEELQFAKKSIKEGKSCGPDNIAPEILKRCDLDEPILYFANKLIIEGMKPT